MVMTHPSLSPQPGIWGNLLGLRSGKNMCQGGKPDTGKFQSYIGMNVCGSAYKMARVLRQRIEY